jgi:hypothetical protein
MGGLRTLHNEELHKNFALHQIWLGWSGQGGWGGQGMQNAWGRSAYKVLVGKPIGKRSLGRSRHRRQDTIKMDLREIRWGYGLDPSGSRQRLMWALLNTVRIICLLQILGICWVAAQLLTSQGHGSMELTSIGLLATVGKVVVILEIKLQAPNKT